MKTSLMPKGSWRFLLIVFCATCSALAEQALVWERTTVETEAKEGDKETEATFSFTNESEKLIEILQISTSCGCVAASVEKKSYLPGESGMIRAKFSFGKRKGLQEKTIIVKTSEPQTPRHVLILRTDIPGGVSSSEKALTWEVGESSEAKIVYIRVPDSSAAQVKEIRGPGSRFETTIAEGGRRAEYKVTIKPVSVQQPAEGVLLVKVADPEPRTIRVLLTVR